MSKKIQRNIPVVKTLHRALIRNKHDDFKDIINCLNDESVNFLCECVRNVCDVKVFNALPENHQRRIKKSSKSHQSDIRKVMKKSTPIRRKRKIIQYGSGWFLPLLSTVIPLITNLFSK